MTADVDSGKSLHQECWFYLKPIYNRFLAKRSMFKGWQGTLKNGLDWFLEMIVKTPE